MTEEQKQSLGEALSKWFGNLDFEEDENEEGQRMNRSRGLINIFDYCDSRNIDDLIERVIAPHVIIIPNAVDPRAIDGFTDWFARTFPRDTVINDPHWNAPKVYRAALAFAKPNLSGATDAQRTAIAVADERMHAHDLPTYSELLAQIAANDEPPREIPDTLFNAALDCTHVITNEQVTLNYDPDRPGHNALAQLALRLAAVRPLAPTPKTLEEAQIWLNQNAPGFNGAPAVIQTIAEADIREERERQDKQWGGPAHDDEHTPSDFIGYVQRQCNLASLQLGDAAVSRSRFVKIAALAVAAIESIDRKTKA
jgi:hypothetical protein